MLTFWLTFFQSYMLPLWFSGFLSYLVGTERRTSRCFMCKRDNSHFLCYFKNPSIMPLGIFLVFFISTLKHILPVVIGSNFSEYSKCKSSWRNKKKKISGYISLSLKDASNFRLCPLLESHWRPNLAHWLHGTSLYRVFHYHPSIVSIWLK